MYRKLIFILFAILVLPACQSNKEVSDETKDNEDFAKEEKLINDEGSNELDISKAIQEAITIEVSSWELYGLNNDKYYGYKIESDLNISNNTENPIKALLAQVSYIDIFGDEIKSLELKYDEYIIDDEESVVFNAVMDINRFDDQDMRLFNSNFENLTFHTEIKRIIFNNGDEWHKDGTFVKGNGELEDSLEEEKIVAEDKDKIEDSDKPAENVEAEEEQTSEKVREDDLEDSPIVANEDEEWEGYTWEEWSGEDVEFEVDEETKTIVDDQTEPQYNENGLLRYAPLEGVACPAEYCVPLSELPETAYFGNDGMIYDSERAGTWELLDWGWEFYGWN